MCKKVFFSLTCSTKSPFGHSKLSRILQWMPVRNIELDADRIFFIIYSLQICSSHFVITGNMATNCYWSDV